jgi:hypothetical protein
VTAWATTKPGVQGTPDTLHGGHTGASSSKRDYYRGFTGTNHLGINYDGDEDAYAVGVEDTHVKSGDQFAYDGYEYDGTYGGATNADQGGSCKCPEPSGYASQRRPSRGCAGRYARRGGLTSTTTSDNDAAGHAHGDAGGRKEQRRPRLDHSSRQWATTTTPTNDLDSSGRTRAYTPASDVSKAFQGEVTSARAGTRPGRRRRW